MAVTVPIAHLDPPYPIRTAMDDGHGFVYLFSERWRTLVLIQSPEGPPVVGDRSGAEPAPPPRRHPLGISLNPSVRKKFRLDGARCPCGREMDAA